MWLVAIAWWSWCGVSGAAVCRRAWAPQSSGHGPTGIPGFRGSELLGLKRPWLPLWRLQYCDHLHPWLQHLSCLCFAGGAPSTLPFLYRAGFFLQYLGMKDLYLWLTSGTPVSGSPGGGVVGGLWVAVSMVLGALILVHISLWALPPRFIQSASCRRAAALGVKGGSLRYTRGWWPGQQFWLLRDGGVFLALEASGSALRNPSGLGLVPFLGRQN